MTPTPQPLSFDQQQADLSRAVRKLGDSCGSNSRWLRNNSAAILRAYADMMRERGL